MFRKSVLLAAAALTALSLLPQPVSAQGKKDSVVMAMALEPPGLDPTSGAAAAIGEVTLYNVYETLTRVKEDGTAAPLLAESWTTSPDVKTYTFRLRKGVKFQNGEPLNAETVKFSFERSAAPASTNKDKSLFQSIAEIATPDADTVVIKMKNPEPNLPFLLGQAPASIVEPKSVATNGTNPVGTGPYTVAAWAKGSSITLNKWPEYRNAAAIKLNKVVIRFISDPSAQVASLLSGDVDAFPRVAAARSLAQFRADPRFNVLIGGSRSKTIVAINNRKKPFDDVRVRRAVLAAQLAKVGIVARIENLEWAQWLSGVFNATGPQNYDLTIVSHVEPFDLVKYTEDNYYTGYRSDAFNALYKQITEAANDADRARLLGDAQRMLATDAAAGFLFQPQLITITNRKLKGVWTQVPLYANDFSEWAWE